MTALVQVEMPKFKGELEELLTTWRLTERKLLAATELLQEAENENAR